LTREPNALATLTGVEALLESRAASAVEGADCLGRDHRRVVASFVYNDERGTPEARVDRREPGRDGHSKEFLPYLADGRGGFAKQPGLNGKRLPLYRFDELRAAIRADAVPWLSEGEGKSNVLRAALRDAGRADAVTTIFGGANALFTDAHLAQLEGASAVVVLADSDTPGRFAAQKRGQAIADKYPACDVRIVDLFPDRTDGSDVADFFEEGGTLDEILALVCTATAVVPSPVQSLPSASTRPECVTVGALLAEPEEKYDYLVDGLLPGGGTSLLIAKPKVGKSTLAQNLAFCVARGEPFLGRRVKRGPVLYLALEEKRSELQQHFRMMGANGDDAIVFYVGRAPERALAWLEDEVAKQKPVLIIVDTAQRFLRLRDLNDYASVTNAFDPLTHLARESGAHLMFTHHAKKSGGRDGDAVLGSTGLFGGVDTLLEMRRREGGIRSISSIQRYGDDLEQTVIALDPKTFRLTARGSAAESDRRRVEVAMVEHFETASEAETREEVFAAVEGRTGVKVAALSAVVESGMVLRTGEGKRGNPYLYAAPLSCSPVPDIRREQENRQPQTCKLPYSREVFSGSQVWTGALDPEPVVKLTPGARAIRDKILADIGDVFDENGRVRP
jgi:hypothetical protein